MNLRKLELKDIPLMPEWMHDGFVIQYMQADFQSKTEDDCRRFITDSWNDRENFHMAIVDDDDVHQGTVSLKHITDSSAEFAITIRTSAMGKGISSVAMERMLEIGFTKLHLSEIYWCISPENVRAVRFYDKNGYKRIDPPANLAGEGLHYCPNLILYMVSGSQEGRIYSQPEQLNMSLSSIMAEQN